MNIFQNKTVGFRQGRGLTDDTIDVSVLRLPVPVPVLGDGSTRPLQASAVGVSAAPESAADFPEVLGAPQQTRRVSGKSDRCAFPSVPYYGILSRCEVQIDVSVADSAPTRAVSSTGAHLRNPVTLLAGMAEVQRRLHSATERFGAIYYLGTCATLSDSVMAPPPVNQGTSWTSSLNGQLTCGAYVQALHDVYRRFSVLRQTCVAAAEVVSDSTPATRGDGVVTHHTFHLRLLGHPSWKDLSALLCVEQGRLLVCLIASSRVTQKHLTAACADSGVKLDWLSGAALMEEPLPLNPGDINPVWVAWDALVHLPLFLPSWAKQEGITGGLAGTAGHAAEALDHVTAATREFMTTVKQSRTVFSGFHISLISSMPFQGAMRCNQVGRIVAETPVFAQEDHSLYDSLSEPAAATDTASCFPPTAARCVTRQTVIAYRYVWRLIPPPPPSSLVAESTSPPMAASPQSCCVVLPFFMSKLLSCLVEDCGLTAFTVRCGGPAEVSARFATSSSLAGSTPPGAFGLRLVQSDAPSWLTLQQGPSSCSCLGFSRLSGAVWVDAETREGLSLGGFTPALSQLGEDAVLDKEEAEMEFEVASITYERRSITPMVKGASTSMSDGGTAAVDLVAGECIGRLSVENTRRDTVLRTGGEYLDAFVHPSQWGACFSFVVAVRRLITVDDQDE
ncbi:hypothetical protein JKF63_05402 [Porcisia hertigi]|uniref:Uncharacterized protein n=1 Tax=Porcisia hertigi TaxID=2761500 RepID=A0A836LIN2_9TRYP|nr:hypothetical protein JKF63_05402 [Porcisia hertigi]